LVNLINKIIISQEDQARTGAFEPDDLRRLVFQWHTLAAKTMQPFTEGE
jgi:hypothetical protein